MNASTFWNKKKVTVAGGAGMIGSYLTEFLVRAGAYVTVADNLQRGSDANIKPLMKKIDFIKKDLREFKNALSVCRKQEFVFNLAAQVTGIEYNRTHQAEMFHNNMLLQQNVLMAASEVGVHRFVQVSTACVYPHDAVVPTPESEGKRGEPEPTNRGYGWAKRMGELLAEHVTRETGMECVIVRPFNAYGARDNFGEMTSHVIPALMKKILEGNEPVEVWGSGNQKRVFVHAKDVAFGMLLLAEKAPPADPVNVGHDEMVSIKVLYTVITKVLGKSPRPFFNTQMPEGYPARAADITKLKKITGGFVPNTISLEDGIREMADWYKKHCIK
jgi:nucleoside-diphosphate-sugar epimerase